MNKYTKLILSGALLMAPSYGTTIGNIDWSTSDAGPLNVVGDTILNAGKTITFGANTYGTIASNVTLTNNGTIKYVPTEDPDSGANGVFRAGGGSIDQNYTDTAVTGKIDVDKISYTVKYGATLDSNTSNKLADFDDGNQVVLYDGYNGGAMTPNLPTLSAPIKYTADGNTYTFGTDSKTDADFDFTRMKASDTDTAAVQAYLTEFGITTGELTVTKTSGDPRIDALKMTDGAQAVLIPDSLDSDTNITISMDNTNDAAIAGNLHNTGQNKTIKFTTTTTTSGELTLSGNNASLKDVDFGAKNNVVPVNFSGTNSIPSGTVNCYGDVTAGDGNAAAVIPANATLNILGTKLSGSIKASSGSTINIGAPKV